MQIIDFFSNIAMPFIILIIIIYELNKKNKVFDTFLDGAKEGLEIVFKIFPTLIGLFVAIGTLRSSGIIDFITKILSPILNIINFPSEIMPLALLRPISGSASIAVATDIIKNFGVDSNIGLIASIIMGSTETTLYTIAVYSSSVGIKKTRFVLIPALIADFVGIITSVFIVKIFWWYFLEFNFKNLLSIIRVICKYFYIKIFTLKKYSDIILKV